MYVELIVTVCLIQDLSKKLTHFKRLTQQLKEETQQLKEENRTLEKQGKRGRQKLETGYLFLQCMQVLRITFDARGS